ncbi:MAG TPA: glycerol-3-phosphate 1-O-acyltransferase PlsY [Acidobacteriota bacterium]|nr:glycerol-3-phosphate 1-O-acyltransferase PlsY [Acidobacteriota bacterium]
MTLALTIVTAYIAGSIPSAVWIGRMVRGIDVREHGSGNMGAANAARVLGWQWGIAAGLVDIAKGFAPVFWLGPIAAAHCPLPLPEARLILGAVAILGHLFPVFVGFRGGKGVLTSLGVFLAILPLDIGIGIAVWIAVFGLTRIVSVGSLAAVAATALSVIIRRFVFDVPIATSLVVAAILLAVLVFYTHRTNIQRIRQGTEHRFGKR